jgi:triosephosphate isomerase
MRRKIVAGNWKMNLEFQQGLDHASQIIHELGNRSLSPELHVLIATPFIHLNAVSGLVGDASQLIVAAQNCSHLRSGALTGEVSAQMIRSCGASAVIIGHSERRTLFDEDDLMLKNKTEQALAAGLQVVFCVGETLEERNMGTFFETVANQVSSALFHLPSHDWSRIVIAYEPVWAIGTGLTATTHQAQEMHAFIRNLILKKHGKELSEKLSILYGGSCNASNAADLFVCEDVDGGLIGGASLKCSDFMAIIDAMQKNLNV